MVIWKTNVNVSFANWCYFYTIFFSLLKDLYFLEVYSLRLSRLLLISVSVDTFLIPLHVWNIFKIYSCHSFHWILSSFIVTFTSLYKIQFPPWISTLDLFIANNFYFYIISILRILLQVFLEIATELLPLFRFQSF